MTTPRQWTGRVALGLWGIAMLLLVIPAHYRDATGLDQPRVACGIPLGTGFEVTAVSEHQPECVHKARQRMALAAFFLLVAAPVAVYHLGMRADD